MEFKEFSAKTVDEAITKASLEFETSSENLEIQVVSEGKTGFLGFGAKPAIIKVKRKKAADVSEEIPVKKETPVKAREEKKEVKSAPVKEPKHEVYKETAEKEDVPVRENERVREERKAVVRSEEEIAEIKAEAEKFLTGVFKAMELPVEMKIQYKEPEGNLDIEFVGQDMGILIGKRGQTLDSLQYLTSLVVNKGRQGYIRVKLDTEDYRNRRKETLENLARSIAYKVRKTRKTVSLEPMNPYERRIIHSALQGNRYVETYSEGNEPYRHVVVKLKNR